MPLHHLIAQSIKQIVAANPTLNADLPGDLHYGRADTGTPRPYASMTIEETGREYNSGGGCLVDYLLTLKVFSTQKVRTVGSILQDFGVVFNRSLSLPAIPADLAEVVAIVPTGGPLSEDEDEEYGKDCMVGQMGWEIRLSESERALVRT